MKAWIVAVGSALLAIIGVFFAGRNSGAEEKENEINEKVLSNVEKSNQAYNDATNVDAGDQFKQLYKDGHK